CSAVATPTMPAPRTIASVRAMVRSCVGWAKAAEAQMDTLDLRPAVPTRDSVRTLPRGHGGVGVVLHMNSRGAVAPPTCPACIWQAHGEISIKDARRTIHAAALLPRISLNALVRPTGRWARLARPPGDARGRGVAVRRPRAAVARGGDEAAVHAERVRAALPRISARRSGRPAPPLRPSPPRAGPDRLGDGRYAARLRSPARGFRA